MCGIWAGERQERAGWSGQGLVARLQCGRGCWLPNIGGSQAPATADGSLWPACLAAKAQDEGALGVRRQRRVGFLASHGKAQDHLGQGQGTWRQSRPQSGGGNSMADLRAAAALTST